MSAPLSLSHTHGSTDVALPTETIGAALTRTVERFGDRDALVSCEQDIHWTWTGLDAEVAKVAKGLLALGFEKGQRLGVWSPTKAEWTVVQYATARLGVILVNINPAYRTHEVQYALAQSGCRGLISASRFKTSDYEAMVAEVRPSLPELEHVVFIGTDSWQAMIDGGTAITDGDLERVEATLDAGDPINIQYTSGTTGSPKGATLTHRNILNNGYFIGAACRYSELDRICLPVPLYHCFGMVLGNLAALTWGACVVYPSGGFDASATLRAIESERCTSLYGVPTMFIAELADPDFASYDLTSLRTGMMAGSPCPVEVMKQTMELMHMSEVTIGYGMTETSPASTITAVDDPVDLRVSTVGRVLPHIEIRVADPETGETVPPGVSGEFCTRGYSVMSGYWNDPERTAEAVDAEGWMHTGDVAVMDEAGYVSIVGRIKDMVIRGGENVYPREVEEFLYSHPRIRDVQVVGVPDERFGEELMAWVQTDDGGDLSTDDVRAFCEGRIAHYKIPRYVAVIDEFPMTVTGKIQKFQLRDLAIERLGLADSS